MWEELEKFTLGAFTPSPHTHPRSEIPDFWNEAFWANIPDKPSTYPPSSHTHDDRYYTETELNNGQLDPRYYTETEIDAFFEGESGGKKQVHWDRITNKPGTFTPSAHALVGAKHTASGLTIGHVIRATGATSFAWMQPSHGDLGGVLTSQHHIKTTHDEVYGLLRSGLIGDRPAAGTAGRLWYATDESILYRDNITGWVEVSRGEAVTRLAQLSEKAHGSLTGVTSDQHHAESHTLASHSTKAHSELTGVTPDLHHAQNHETRHRSGGDDELNHDNLAGYVLGEHLLLPSTIALVLSDHNKTAHDALSLSHDSLSDVSIDDHHAKVHALVGAEHSASGLTAGHVLRATAPTTFAWMQLGHGDLGGVTSDLHHPQAHTLASHSTKAHSELTGVTSDLHHPQSHTLASHSTKAHSELTGVTENQHHDKLHSMTGVQHSAAGLTIGHVLRATGAATFAWMALSHGDLGGVTSDQHHPQVHTHDDRYYTETELNDGQLDTRYYTETEIDAFFEGESGGKKQVHWDRITNKPGTFTPSAHALVGAKHTASGLTTGHVVRATGAGAFAWMQLSHGDLGGVTANLHHDENHASRHYNAGADAVKLDDLAIPDDNVDLDASTARHGLLRKLTGSTANFLRADGAWAAPTPAAHNLLSAVHGDTLTAGVVRGDILVGNLTPKWSRLAKGGAGRYLRAGANDPTWEFIGAADLPNHASRHHSGGADQVNHDSLAGFVGSEHLALPNTIALVLSNHTKTIHDALGLSHDSLSNVSINDHHNKVHALVGAEHSASGLAAGQVIRATGASTFAWMFLSHGDLAGIGANDHHPQSHTLVSHTARDHHNLTGLGDDDHSQYYNAARHTKAVHDALGINAGLVDGFSASQTRNLANTCAVRDASGYLQLGWINTTSGDRGTTAPTRIYGSNDDYIRYYTPTNFATVMKPYFDNHFLLLTGGILSGAVEAADHTTAGVDKVVNIAFWNRESADCEHNDERNALRKIHGIIKWHHKQKAQDSDKVLLWQGG
ncbi:hypothetical protein ES702_07519 [subsurface metagenome]